MKPKRMSWRTVALVLGATLGTGGGASAECALDDATRPMVDQALAAERFEDVLARGKLETDLGNVERACGIFAELGQARSAPDRVQWDALVREGIARRQLADWEGSVKAFQDVFARFGNDSEAVRWLVEAISGASSDPEHWETVWRQVRIDVDRTNHAEPRARASFPGSESAAANRLGLPTDPITLNVRDALLSDVLSLFGEISRVNVVVDPALKGRTVSLVLTSVPANRVLELLLATQGLVADREGKQLTIRPTERRAGGMATREGVGDPVAQMKAALRTICIAAQAYRQDHGEFPVTDGDVDVGAIASQLSPAYVAVVPRWDASGKPFRVTSDGASLSVSGSDPDGGEASVTCSVPEARVGSQPK